MGKDCSNEPLSFSKADAIRLTAALAVALFASQRPAVAQTTPQIFAPGIISGPAHDASAAFTPDGKTVFFSRSNTSSSTVLVSQGLGDSWSQPQIASFSGEWEDMEPTMSPDGSYLLFISNRPLHKGDKAADGFFNGKSWPGRGSAIWRVDRTATGWGEPYPLPAKINSGPTVFAPSVAGNGSVYFMKPDGQKNKFRLFRAHWNGHGFDAPEPLPFSTGEETDVDPAVAPDESFIVFGSGRAPAKSLDLFICFQDDGSWGTPIHLGDVVNSPGSDAEARLSPDHRTLYFASDRVAPTKFPESLEARKHDLEEMAEWNNSLYNIWFVSLDPWLKQHQTQGK
jgi:Tol biopolymer transport system component